MFSSIIFKILEINIAAFSCLQAFVGDFVLEKQENCNYEYVALYDGNSTNDALLGKFCGNKRPGRFISTSHRFLLAFRQLRNESKFKVQYSTGKYAFHNFMLPNSISQSHTIRYFAQTGITYNSILMIPDAVSQKKCIKKFQIRK